MNCGDSLSVLIGPKKIMKLNNEHTPNNESERKNLDAKGAIVLERKKVFRVLGELAVSRSFGDKNYKEFITAEPEVLNFEMEEGYDYLVMATDGFWNVKLKKNNRFIW
jgi:serine/threonine protein phosphatase PrpC